MRAFQVWPFLVGFVQWSEDLTSVYSATKIAFEEQMTAWMAVEAIVRQRDKEQFQAGPPPPLLVHEGQA